MFSKFSRLDWSDFWKLARVIKFVQKCDFILGLLYSHYGTVYAGSVAVFINKGVDHLIWGLPIRKRGFKLRKETSFNGTYGKNERVLFYG